jgi:hypothetical protein
MWPELLLALQVVRAGAMKVEDEHLLKNCSAQLARTGAVLVSLRVHLEVLL